MPAFTWAVWLTFVSFLGVVPAATQDEFVVAGDWMLLSSLSAARIWVLDTGRLIVAPGAEIHANEIIIDGELLGVDGDGEFLGGASILVQVEKNLVLNGHVVSGDGFGHGVVHGGESASRGLHGGVGGDIVFQTSLGGRIVFGEGHSIRTGSGGGGQSVVTDVFFGGTGDSGRRIEAYGGDGGRAGSLRILSDSVDGNAAIVLGDGGNGGNAVAFGAYRQRFVASSVEDYSSFLAPTLIASGGAGGEGGFYFAPAGTAVLTEETHGGSGGIGFAAADSAIATCVQMPRLLAPVESSGCEGTDGSGTVPGEDSKCLDSDPEGLGFCTPPTPGLNGLPGISAVAMGGNGANGINLGGDGGDSIAVGGLGGPGLAGGKAKCELAGCTTGGKGGQGGDGGDGMSVSGGAGNGKVGGHGGDAYAFGSPGGDAGAGGDGEDCLDTGECSYGGPGGWGGSGGKAEAFGGDGGKSGDLSFHDGGPAPPATSLAGSGGLAWSNAGTGGQGGAGGVGADCNPSASERICRGGDGGSGGEGGWAQGSRARGGDGGYGYAVSNHASASAGGPGGDASATYAFCPDWFELLMQFVAPGWSCPAQRYGLGGDGGAAGLCNSVAGNCATGGSGGPGGFARPTIAAGGDGGSAGAGGAFSASVGGRGGDVFGTVLSNGNSGIGGDGSDCLTSTDCYGGAGGAGGSALSYFRDSTIEGGDGGSIGGEGVSGDGGDATAAVSDGPAGGAGGRGGNGGCGGPGGYGGRGAEPPNYWVRGGGASGGASTGQGSVQGTNNPGQQGTDGPAGSGQSGAVCPSILYDEIRNSVATVMSVHAVGVPFSMDGIGVPDCNNFFDPELFCLPQETAQDAANTCTRVETIGSSDLTPAMYLKIESCDARASIWEECGGPSGFDEEYDCLILDTGSMGTVFDMIILVETVVYSV